MSDIIVIHTDGGCRGNQGDNNVGGWGALLEFRGKSKEIYGGEKNTTNNIQELKGVINALKTIKTNNLSIELFCDSAYVVNGVNQWVSGWKKRGWKKSDGKIIENLELWKELDKLISLQSNLKVIKIKGHVGHYGNEKADELANKAMNEIGG